MTKWQIERINSGGFGNHEVENKKMSLNRAYTSQSPSKVPFNDQSSFGSFLFKQNDFDSSGNFEPPIEEEDNIIDSIMKNYVNEDLDDKNDSENSFKSTLRGQERDQFTLRNLKLIKNRTLNFSEIKKTTNTSLSVGMKPKKPNKPLGKGKETQNEKYSMDVVAASSLKTKKTLRSHQSEHVSVRNYLADAQMSDSNVVVDSSNQESDSDDCLIEDETLSILIKNEEGSEGLLDGNSIGKSVAESQAASWMRSFKKSKVVSGIIEHYSDILTFSVMLVTDRTDGLASTSIIAFLF